MLLYLRHGDDRGEDIYRHDRRLNARGRRKAAKKARRLIDKHGHPDVVFVSPFRRATETLSCMTRHFTRPVDIRCDCRIAQLLTDKHKRDLRVSPETRAVIVIDENLSSFRGRITAHVEDVRRAETGAVIWCITHQVVIEEIAQHFVVKISGSLDFLDHVLMLR